LSWCVDRGDGKWIKIERGKGGTKKEEALAVHVMPPLSHLGDIPNMQEFSAIFRILLAVCYPCRSTVEGQRSHKVLITQTEAIKRG
jgi:hypothetical protein